jgi:hypothetical protein
LTITCQKDGMEFGNDLIGALRDRLGRGATESFALHPDWFGLRASQAAAWAVRRELLRDLARSPVADASFDRETAAQLLAGFDGSQSVNPTDSADGKYPAGIAGIAAGATAVGDRGQ